MRTITNLYKEGDTVFIRFENEAVGRRFLQDAERENFLINGKLPPTKGNPNEACFRLRRNGTKMYISQ